MGDIINLYCDESCHLENDSKQAMVLGTIRCPASRVSSVSERIREIKLRHGLPAHQEIKWTKVTPSKHLFYKDLIDYFFDDDDLGFRAVIINKEQLNHAAFCQSHDTFYYKMYYLLIENVLKPDSHYRIFLDIKDTHGAEKIRALHRCLCNSHYDFDQKIIQNIQLVRSHEIQILQLVDLMIGALSYLHRGLSSSQTKVEIIDRIRKRSGYRLTSSTLPSEQKLNLLVWRGREHA